jgi:hypothetical protein
VRSTTPLRGVDAYEADIGLIHESGALQRVVWTLVLQMVSSQTSELFVDQRHEGIKRLAVPGPPAAEEVSHPASRLV